MQNGYVTVYARLQLFFFRKGDKRAKICICVHNRSCSFSNIFLLSVNAPPCFVRRGNNVEIVRFSACKSFTRSSDATTATGNVGRPLHPGDSTSAHRSIFAKYVLCLWQYVHVTHVGYCTEDGVRHQRARTYAPIQGRVGAPLNLRRKQNNNKKSKLV